MKRILQRALLVSALVLPFASAQAATETYTLDPGHSYVEWHISHFDFSHPSGKWYANGTLELDKDKPQNSKVNVTINVGDIVTGIPKLDEHLKGADFFDVAKYPTATFVSNKVDVSSKKTAKVYGTLTLHGVSKPVVLNVTLNKEGISPITNKPTAGFAATTTIKRSEFGITKYLPGLGDEVKLNIEIEATKEGANNAEHK